MSNALRKIRRNLIVQVNLTQKFTELNGDDILGPRGPITLGYVCMTALGANFQDEMVLSGEEKVKLFAPREALSHKLKQAMLDGGEASLSPEELVSLRTLVGKLYPVVVVGQAFRMLE